MTTTARRRLSPARGVVTGMVVCLMVLTGCSSGPSADEWAAAVCDALSPWRTTIASLNERAATQMATATTSAQTRENIMVLLNGARQASETARAAIAAAGVPDVDGGDEVARGFEASLAGTRDAYAQAEAELAVLPIADDVAFYDGVEALLTRLTDQYKGNAVDLARLDSPQLRQAFDGNASCR